MSQLAQNWIASVFGESFRREKVGKKQIVNVKSIQKTRHSFWEKRAEVAGDRTYADIPT